MVRCYGVLKMRYLKRVEKILTKSGVDILFVFRILNGLSGLGFVGR